MSEALDVKCQSCGGSGLTVAFVDGIRNGRVYRLPAPVPCKGHQGLWALEGRALERVLVQAAGAQALDWEVAGA